MTTSATDISILVVDDEMPARAELLSILKKNHSEFQYFEAEMGKQALELQKKHQSQIVFLDIQLLDINGMKVAEFLLKQKRPPAIIMATAHDQYALQGFDLDVTDYLLKPFRSSRVEKALNKALDYIEGSKNKAGLTNLLEQVTGQKESIQKLWVENEKGSRLIVNFDDIAWIEAKNKKVYIQVGLEQFRVRATLAELAERLPQHTFIRVHKSYIININLVKEVIPWDSHVMTLIMGDDRQTEIPVGRGYADKLKTLVGW